MTEEPDEELLENIRKFVGTMTPEQTEMFDKLIAPSLDKLNDAKDAEREKAKLKPCPRH